MKKNTKRAATLAFLSCFGAGDAYARPADWNQNDWVKFIEEGVQIGLGEALSHAGSAVPLVDVYSALSAFGGSTNVGLHKWLQAKMVDAGDNQELINKYQAYDTCLTTPDCSRLKALAEKQPPPNTAACKEVQTFDQPETRVGTKITVEASTIHVMDCNGIQTYVYEYLNRPGFRVINPPDWGHVIGGKDFQTLAEATNVAAGQTTSSPQLSPPTPTPTPGADGNPQKMTVTVKGYSGSVDLVTGKVTSEAGTPHGTDVAIYGVGNFSSADVTVTADKPLPLGWSISAGTCCSVVIPICKAAAGAASCTGTINVPKDWPGVNVLGGIVKADQEGKTIGSDGVAIILYKKPE
jgi:hypothetical protein